MLPLSMNSERSSPLKTNLFLILAQMRQYPAISLLKAVEQESRNRIADETLILADQATEPIMQTDVCLEKRRKIAWQV